MQKYGIPYMGSKSTIAEWVISHLPPADNLIDLFAGGCALTHAAIKSRKFKNILVNDITDAPKLFIDAAKGKYRDEKRWISREEFLATKDIDPFVRIIWSFGNNQKQYIYAQETEQRKHAIHNAVHHGQTPPLAEYDLIDTDDVQPLKNQLAAITNTWERYTLVKRTIIKHYKAHTEDCRCETIERTARLQHIERTARLQHIEATQKDYRNVKIPQGNTILLCDIPYFQSAGYLNDFDHEQFYQWVKAQHHPTYICEYSMPQDFTLIDQIHKNSQLSASTTKKATEKLFGYNIKPYRDQLLLF